MASDENKQPTPQTNDPVIAELQADIKQLRQQVKGLRLAFSRLTAGLSSDTALACSEAREMMNREFPELHS